MIIFFDLCKKLKIFFLTNPNKFVILFKKTNESKVGKMISLKINFIDINLINIINQAKMDEYFTFTHLLGIRDQNLPLSR